VSQRKLGTVLSYVYILFNVLAGLLVTKYTVHTLGKDEYGLFTLMGGLATNMQILELGLNDSVVRFMSKFRAHDDKEGENNFLAHINRIYAFISMAVVVVGIVLWFVLPSMFPKMTTYELVAARTMLAISTVNVAVTLFVNPFTASIVAYERFVLLRTLDIFTVLATNLGVVVVLHMGYRSVQMVAVIATISMIVLAVKIGYALAVLKVRPRLARFDTGLVRQVFAFSAAVFVVVIVEQIYWRLDGAILGNMLDLATVGIYSIGMSFSKYFMSFGTAISKVMMPKLVKQVEHGASATDLTNVLIQVSRLQSIILLPVLGGLIVFGREFIDLWVGPHFATAYWVMLVTLIPYSIELIGNVRNQIMQAKDIYWQRSRVILIMSLINVVVTIVLIKVMGMVGAALSTGLGILAGYIWINEVLKQQLGLEIGRYRREMIEGMLPAMAIAGAVGWATYFIPGHSWGWFLLRAAIYATACVLSIWFIGARPSEKRMFQDTFRRRVKPKEATANA